MSYLSSQCAFQSGCIELQRLPISYLIRARLVFRLQAPPHNSFSRTAFTFPGKRSHTRATTTRSVATGAEPDAFSQLLVSAGATGCVTLAESAFQNGLVTTRDVLEGDVLLRVPREACLLLDYDVGLSLRQAAWPELKAALEVEDLPWDLLFALALVDASRGEGDPFWKVRPPMKLFSKLNEILVWIH